MNPLLPLSLVFVSLVTPALLAPAPTPEDGIDLATGDSNLHYAYGHAYGKLTYLDSILKNFHVEQLYAFLLLTLSLI